MDHFQKKLIELIRITYALMTAIGLVILVLTQIPAYTEKSHIPWEIFYTCIFFLITENAGLEQYNFDDTGKDANAEDFDSDFEWNTSEVYEDSNVTEYNSASDTLTESCGGSESNSRVTTDKFDEIPEEFNFSQKDINTLMEYYDENITYFYLATPYDDYDTSMAWTEVKMKVADDQNKLQSKLINHELVGLEKENKQNQNITKTKYISLRWRLTYRLKLHKVFDNTAYDEFYDTPRAWSEKKIRRRGSLVRTSPKLLLRHRYPPT